MKMAMDMEKEQMHLSWIIPMIRNLIHDGFTGSIRINFHKGQLSKKVEKTSYISEK